MNDDGRILYALKKRDNIIEYGSLVSCALEYGKRKYGFGDVNLSVVQIKIIELAEVPKYEIEQCLDQTYNPGEEVS